MSATCRICGEELAAGAAKCSFCGTAIAVPDAAPNVAVVQPATAQYQPVRSPAPAPYTAPPVVNINLPSSPAQAITLAVTQKAKTAQMIELILSIFSIHGIGYIYSGRILKGILLLIGCAFVINLIILIAGVVTAGAGLIFWLFHVVVGWYLGRRLHDEILGTGK